MAIDGANVSANSGLNASLANEQQVAQYGAGAAAWGNNIMDSVLGDMFGNSKSNGDSLSTGPQNSSTNELLQIAFELGELFAELEQLAGQQGGGGQPGSGSGMQPEQMYSNASGSSWGDPHQSFNGSSSSSTGSTTQSGTSNNMHSQSDLIDANDSFNGGYQVSTQTTAPNANGITYNGSATVSTNDGYSQVTMGANGQVSVWDDGQYLNLNKGQSVTLTGGATVSEAANGAVTIDDKNAQGGNMSTTLSWNGQGVDVNFAAQNVALGGYDTTLGQSSNVQPLVG